MINKSDLKEWQDKYKSYCEADIQRIDELKKKLDNAIENNIEYEIVKYRVKLNEKVILLKKHSAFLKYMRASTIEDYEERIRFLSEFSDLVKKSIPDDIPYVFHGTSNIGIVYEIIKSGGLFPPDEREVGYSSFATQIDVTQKNYIQTSCEFAEPGLDRCFVPYGAIFVFMPRDDEIEKVLHTKGSEVPDGVAGVNFRKHPEKLIAIISTTENKERLISWCNENAWESSKVFTQDEFISYCRKKFNIEKEGLSK